MKTLLLILVIFVTASNAYALPSFQEVKDSYRKSDAVLLDRHGEVIHELRVDAKRRRLDWTELKDISPSLIKAVIHSEDKRFYEHHGVDWRALGSAAVKNIFTKKERGASTIAMQLAAMLDKRLKPGKSKRTLSQKWDQIETAREIDGTWSKDAILEAYLNLVTFRGELQGIAVASRGIFDKEPAGLDGAESAILASLIRSPNAQVNDVTKRACALSTSMKAQASCEHIKKLAVDRLSAPYAVRPRIGIAPHVAQKLLKKENEKIVSTLDARIQRFAFEALRYHVSALKNQNVHDGAVLVVENKTGDIVAYVANTGQSSSARHVDGIRAKRQAGSTLKPFLYGYAIEKRILTAASILDDSPLNASTSLGLYVPQNYDHEFKGYVSVRTSLSASLNIPAVRTLMLIGADDFVGRMGELGFYGLHDGEYYGLSLALGSVDVSLYELVNAYRTLTNGGIWSELRLTAGANRSTLRRVMTHEAVFIISDILSDRGARSVTFGFENPLSARFWTAVKTGTSKDMKDNWCIGYSGGYTVGVWVGNFSGEPMWNVSGISGAAPVWLEIMNYLHRYISSSQPSKPQGVITKRVIFENGIEAERNELFIAGTEPVDVHSTGLRLSTDSGKFYARIVYPADGTIIALDPDIPEDHHKVFFDARPATAGYEWILNNEKLGVSGASVAWKPKKGKYVLSLTDGHGLIIDSVEFQVRGTETVQ